jgi:hypothetical protein
MEESMAEKDSITIRGVEIPFETKYLEVKDLLFYSENPRIYSIVTEAGREPSQDEIYAKLSEMEHVKELRRSIKQNSGLREPVIVRKWVVFEGNSRLAAYKKLAENDVEYAKIKCRVLKDDIGDDVMFAILADHINGKKDWAPYEQAGYLYRRHKNHKIPIAQIADDMGMSQKAVTKLIQVYDYMLEKSEYDISRWSYYDVFLANRKIKEYRDEFPTLDDVIVKVIRNSADIKATDFREQLTVISRAKKAIIKKLANEERTFSETYESAKRTGCDDSYLHKLKIFRTWISAENTIGIFQKHEESKVEILFELKKIARYSTQLLEKMEKENK